MAGSSPQNEIIRRQPKRVKKTHTPRVGREKASAAVGMCELRHWSPSLPQLLTTAPLLMKGVQVSKAASPLRDEVQSFIGCSTLLWASDGRVIRGNLSCVDKQGNLILEHAEELRPPRPQQEQEQHSFHGRIFLFELNLGDFIDMLQHPPMNSTWEA